MFVDVSYISITTVYHSLTE